jgi:hypothetical protein
MSATATFELPPDLDGQAIRDAVRRIWTDDSVELLVEPEGRATLHLSWYVVPQEQADELRRVAVYLLEQAAGRPLYYIRDSEGYVPGECPDYPRPVTVDELVSHEFQPAMHNGVHYRYLICERSAASSNST